MYTYDQHVTMYETLMIDPGFSGRQAVSVRVQRQAKDQPTGSSYASAMNAMCPR